MTKELFKKGDEVICVSTDGYGQLEVGQKYRVHRYNTCETDEIFLGYNDYDRSYPQHCFELFNGSIETKISIAKNLVGKQIKVKGSQLQGIVKSWHIADPTTNDELSSTVKLDVSKNSYSVYVRYTSDACKFLSPVLDVELVPEKEPDHVRLNSEYVAMVYDDKVVVGCQTITADTIKELYRVLQARK